MGRNSVYLQLACFLLATTYISSNRIYKTNMRPYNELFGSFQLRSTMAQDSDIQERSSGKKAVDTMNPCVLHVNQTSLDYFTRMARRNDLSFAYLRLKVETGLYLYKSKHTVDEDLWIWTYYGNLGGYEFLSWPMDFGIWSLGILSIYVGGPYDIALYNSSGNCSYLKVGDIVTDRTIGRALTNLTESLIHTGGSKDAERYELSFLCYKRRKYIQPTVLYYLCQNMFCPFQALENSCHFYDSHKLSNHQYMFSYHNLLWIGPTIIAVIIFFFSPLFILGLAMKCKEYLMQYKNESGDGRDKYVFLDGSYHITVAKMLLGPLLVVFSNNHCACLRMIRCLLPFMSLSVIGLQIFLDNQYQYELVIKSIENNVHMGFRSMLAGFSQSSEKFLPVLGGPFIVCGFYLLIACLILVVPRSVSATLENGINATDFLIDISPLSLNMTLLERYGSVIIVKKRGFSKVYNVLIARFNICINVKFWKFVVLFQHKRWREFNTNKLRSFLLPFFIVLCLFEVLLCVVFYGIPIVAFGIIIFRAYHALLRRHLGYRFSKVCVYLSDVILLISLVLFCFIFCSVFLDACRFISRVCIFTFTGMVVYPTAAYGYFIFFATVIYYLWEYFNNFAMHYNNILQLTISACESIQKARPTEGLVKKLSNCKGIKSRLFFDVIDLYSPIRKKILVSFVLFLSTVYILEMAVHLITQRHEFHELHTIMHVGTTLFVCAFPKIIQSMCRFANAKQKRKREKKELKMIIKRCLSYSSDNETSESDLVDLLRT